MIKTKIAGYIKKAIKQNIRIDVFVPENENFGHYSTNVALRLVKARNYAEQTRNYADKTMSMTIAHEIIDSLNKIAPKGFFEKIEVAPPGFINFWLSEKVLQNELKEILKKKENYGAGKKKKEKIQLEFISANPTGPLTLANGRGGFFGDSLSNILEFCGYQVEREYYINDTGNQILTLGKSILARASFLKLEDYFYKGGYIKKWTEKNLLAIKKYKDNSMKVGQLAAADFLKEIKKNIKEAGIDFDRWTSEDKHIHRRSFIAKVMNIFKKKRLVYEKDGAIWLKTAKFGDDKDRVLITKDGFPTYFLADSGHYLETKIRGFDVKINVFGPDHYGYVNRIQAAARIIGIKESKIIVTQVLRLISKGKEVKMSKRKGEFVTFEDLIKEVGVDATRFFFLMYSPDTHMDFNLDLAKERSMKNPVYYLQYASVRIQGILTKTKNQNPKSKINFRLLNTTEDLKLMQILAKFPEVVAEAGGKYNPQILVRYSLELAKQFHNFYEKERIIGAEKDLVLARLGLIKATQIIFKNLFNLLGISMPKKM